MLNNSQRKLRPVDRNRPRIDTPVLERAKPLPKWYERRFRLLISAWRWYKNQSRRLKISSLLAVLVSVAAIIFFMRPTTDTPNVTDNIQPTNQKPATRELPKGTPDYKTLLPAGKTDKQLGGWTRVSPKDRDPVYAYTDRLDSIAIIVSQQPVPDDFKSNPAKLQQFAEDYGARDEIDAGGVKVYAGTSANGPESVIFVKNGLLVLIKTDQAVNSNSLIDYIKQLQ